MLPVNDILAGYPLLNWRSISRIAALLMLFSFVLHAAGASPASITIEPSYQKLPRDENVTITISLDPGTNEVFAAQYELHFNTSILHAIAQTKGSVLSQDGVITTVLLNSVNNTLGKIAYGEFRTGVSYGITNPGTLATITFRVIADSGITTLNFSNVILSTSYAEVIVTNVENGTVEAGVPLPYLVTANVSNATISPNGDHHFDCTELKIVFSKPVATTIAIEDADYRIIKELYSNDSVVDPGPLWWYGEYSNGSIVPDGSYFVNITMDDRVNPLVYNNTISIIVDATPPSASNATPVLFIGEIAPLISIDVTDISNVEEDSLKLYLEDLHVLAQKLKLENGYRISYQTEQPYTNGERITARVIARDSVGNHLEHSWNFSVDGEPPRPSNHSPTGVTNNPLPLIAVDITDDHGVEPTSIRLYVKGYRVVSEREELAHGFRVSYQTDYPFRDRALISARIVANDTARNTLDFSWEFMIDTSPPVVVEYSPVGSDVPVTKTIAVTFNRAMNRSSVEDAFSIHPKASGSFSWSGNVLLFAPSRLAYGTDYTVSMKGDAEDLAGNRLDGNGNGIAEGSPLDDFSWQFSTTIPLDTGPGAYPSISGVHTGTMTPTIDIAVNQLYTYPCPGTGGHTELVSIEGNGINIAASWNGYQGDYHTVKFPEQVTLLANHTYNYTIRTGSYPQVHHVPLLVTDHGTMTCTEFRDANGAPQEKGIPAIRLEKG